MCPLSGKAQSHESVFLAPRAPTHVLSAPSPHRHLVSRGTALGLTPDTSPWPPRAPGSVPAPWAARPERLGHSSGTSHGEAGPRTAQCSLPGCLVSKGGDCPITRGAGAAFPELRSAGAARGHPDLGPGILVPRVRPAWEGPNAGRVACCSWWKTTSNCGQGPPRVSALRKALSGLVLWSRPVSDAASEPQMEVGPPLGGAAL